MPSPRINQNEKSETYFLTFTVRKWVNIFKNDEGNQLIINTLKFYQNKLDLRIFAYVIMLNHIHLIAQCDDMVTFCRSFKSYTSKELFRMLEKEENKFLEKSFRNNKGKPSIWIPNNWPELVYTEEFFDQKLNYIHNNPVTKGYVDLPEKWKYSSARNYYLNDHSVIFVETECY